MVEDSEANAIDSDEGQIELVGDMRGSEMVEAEWNVYTNKECDIWKRARERFLDNDSDRQAVKLKFFADNIEEDGDTIGNEFFNSQVDFEQRWGDSSEDDKALIWEAIKKYHGARWTAALEALKEKNRAEDAANGK